MIELLGVNQWIHATLTGSAPIQAIVAGRVYADAAPPGEPSHPYPYVVFTARGGDDRVGVGAHRLLVVTEYLVKSVGVNGYPELQTLVNLIDTALSVRESFSVTLSGVIYQIGGCHRDGVVMYGEEAGGILYAHLGGIYRVYLSP